MKKEYQSCLVELQSEKTGKNYLKNELSELKAECERQNDQCNHKLQDIRVVCHDDWLQDNFVIHGFFVIVILLLLWLLYGGRSRETTLKNDKAMLQNENTTLQCEKIILQKEKSTLQNQKTVLQDEHTNLLNEKVTLQKEKATLEKEKANLQVEKHTLQKEKHSLQRELSILQSSTVHEEYHTLCAKYMPLSEECETQHKQDSDIRDEIGKSFWSRLRRKKGSCK